jgi:glycosyltransferase involved in cell wall biosynthesis
VNSGMSDGMDTGMSNPKLSILIPSLFERGGSLANLLVEIHEQIEVVNCHYADQTVEVLVSIDGGAATVGEKRNQLLRAASGDYIAFVDDDDWISRNYVDELLHAIDDGEKWDAQPDIITFEVEFLDLQTKARKIIVQSLKYVDERQDLGKQREGAPPSHIACWRSEVALCNEFPPISYAEDWLWWYPLLKSGIVKSEYHIDWPLYRYRFDGRKSATQKTGERQKAMEWAGGPVQFYGGNGFKYRHNGKSIWCCRGHELDEQRNLECNGVPFICECHIT